MFKNSSDQLNYIARTASHATKPRPSGRIDDIPAWAVKPEAYYNSIRDQYRSIADQLSKTQNALADINEKLKTNLPFKEYEHLRQHKERLAARYNILQEQSGSYRELARAAGERAWATIFYHIARKMLPLEDFLSLDQEVQQIVGHDQYEIKKGQGMISAEARESRRQHETRRKRRARWNRHKTGSVTVWSDEGPKQQKYSDESK